MVILSSELAWLSVLAWIFLVWIHRMAWISSFRKNNPPLKPVNLVETQNFASLHGLLPKISIIIPAKNEEKNIANCLRHLSMQNHPHYEIIVVDDRSTDETSEILKNFILGVTAGGAPHGRAVHDSSTTSTHGADRWQDPQNEILQNLKIIRVEKLPEGWTGKNHAMFVGSKAAQGDWILFTDADTTHQPESLLTAVTCALERKIDFLTLAPGTESKSFWEKTVQPLAISSLALWFRSDKVNDAGSQITLANGQFILVRKQAYESVGGNESVKSEVIEDVELAKKVRSAGYRVQFLDGTLLYSTRMYTSLKEIHTGWTRIFTYLFNKNIPAILHKIFLFLFFSSLPFFVFIAESILGLSSSVSFSQTLCLASGFLCFTILLARFFGNRALKSDARYAVWHLLGSLIMIWILFSCL